MHTLNEVVEFSFVNDGDGIATGATTTTFVEISGYENITFLFGVGAIASGDDVAVKLQIAEDSSGTNAEDITGKVGAFTDADDSTLGVITVDQKHTTETKPFVGAVITATLASGTVSVPTIALLHNGRDWPEANTDLTFNVGIND